MGTFVTCYSRHNLYWSFGIWNYNTEILPFLTRSIYQALINTLLTTVFSTDRTSLSTFYAHPCSLMNSQSRIKLKTGLRFSQVLTKLRLEHLRSCWSRNKGLSWMLDLDVRCSWMLFVSSLCPSHLKYNLNYIFIEFWMSCRLQQEMRRYLSLRQMQQVCNSSILCSWTIKG